MSATKRSPARLGIAERSDRTGRRQYRGTVYDKQARRHLRGRWTYNVAEAKAWRIDSLAALRAGTLSADKGLTLAEAIPAWIAGARSGEITNRSGDRFKPSAVRGYEQAFRLRIIPAIGASRLGEVRRGDLQRLVARWQAEGLSPSSIRNTVNALRSLYRHALAHGDIAINPTADLHLPAVRGRRDRIVSPADADRLLAALDGVEQTLWACAFYAGLRLGELRALRWEDIDLPAGVIRVRRGWDPASGEIEPKSRAGRRDVPIYRPLRAALAKHRLRAAGTDGLVFGRAQDDPFNPVTANARAKRRWSDAGLEGVGLHEARHCAASFMIAAGLNMKAISSFMGHASIVVTLDRYGHLLPGSEAEATTRMDAFLGQSAAVAYP